MAEYALLNKSTKETISPESALREKSQGAFRVYYCPNPNCNALLVPVKGDDKKHPNPFFRALKSNGHIEGCNYKAYYDEDAALSAIRKRNAGLWESDFSIEVLLEKMKTYIPPEATETITPCNSSRSIQDDEKEAKEKILSNTSKLFHYCRQHEITDRLGEKSINDILIDDRTMFATYKYYIKEGTYLLDIPIYRMKYEKENNTLLLRINKRFLGGIVTDYLFSLHFQTPEAMMKKASDLFDYRDTRSRLIVLASVTRNFGDDTNYFCEIFNDAQLYFNKSEELV